MTNGTMTTKNGIRVPVWALSILLFMAAQVVAGIIAFTALKTASESFQDHMTDEMAEIKFRVANIDDGVRVLQRETGKSETRLEMKCEEFDKRFERLESYHGVTNP